MGWKDYTKEWYAEYQARNKRAGSCARQLQESQASDPGPIHRQDADLNRSQGEAVDGQGCSIYRVSVVLNLADKRERDADGSVTTILDTVINAIGRFAGMDRTGLREWAKSEERRRRSGNPN